jgi:hypothetical protein
LKWQNFPVYLLNLPVERQVRVRRFPQANRLVLTLGFAPSGQDAVIGFNGLDGSMVR